MKKLIVAAFVAAMPLTAQADDTQNVACAAALTWTTQNYVMPNVVYDARNFWMERFADDNGASFVSAFEHILENMDDVEELGSELLRDVSIDCLDMYAEFHAPNV